MKRSAQFLLFKTSHYASLRRISSLDLWNEELTTSIKHRIEDSWRNKIENEKFNENGNLQNKYYVLSMFPYPSGHLHMGHVRVYTISDSVARFQRMNGKNVIHPIGWDAFGLPAENAAIDRNISPYEWTKQNISHMKDQLNQLGCSFEWDREITTCDPKYYTWTQDLFLKLYDADLVYNKEAFVNWDPIDCTVLADEQVDENGCSWRSGAKVEKKLLKQWFVRTTRFAKDLMDGLDDPILQDWRDIIKLQKHWIGDCDGVRFEFKLKTVEVGNDSISVWTKNPEFADCIKFIAVSNQHLLATYEGGVLNEGTKRLRCCALNPLNGDTLPIFVTNEMEYQQFTDCYVGIPGLNDRDGNFARRYNITYDEISTSITAEEIKLKQSKICDEAKQLNCGGYWTSAKLKDWLISRQRYWGTPIPIIHCNKCGSQPVPRDQLPVPLPKLTNLSSRGVLKSMESNDWLHTRCPNCHGPAVRETDTMDTFVDSSWYYLRYLDPKNNEEMFNVDRVKKMAPVDLYIGGKEHAVLHLYYARFISHFLYSCGLLPEREPFKRLLVQGMVMGRCYRIKATGQYVNENEVKVTDSKRNKAVVKDTGDQVTMSWEKMSKSKHNGVSPSDMFKEYGTDTTRLLIMADVAPTSHRNWNSNTFPGILNWQRRLWLTMRDFINRRNNLPPFLADDQFKAHDDFMFDSRNYYVKGATFNYCLSQQMSVAVSKMQGLTNSLRKVPPAVVAHSLQFERALASQIILLAPMAPHFASELWAGFTSAPNRLCSTKEILWDKTVLQQQWPDIDYSYRLDLVCQVNGHENAVIKMPRKELEQLSRNEAIDLALKQEKLQEVLTTRTIVDVKYTVHDRYETVVNFITTQPQHKASVVTQ